MTNENIQKIEYETYEICLTHKVDNRILEDPITIRYAILPGTTHRLEDIYYIMFDKLKEYMRRQK